MKSCTACGIEKTLCEFRKDTRKKSGCGSECKACTNLRKRRWGDANPDRARPPANGAYNAKYYLANKEKLDRKKLEWRKTNPGKAKDHSNKSSRRIRATPLGRLNRNVSRAIIREIKTGSKYDRKTFELLGYTPQELMAHLEKQFVPGMTWGNYGPIWHIDHKIPLAAFHYQTPDDFDFHRAWALNNLQPMFAADNIRKRDRLDTPFQPTLL